MTHLLVDTFFELMWSQFFFRGRITVILTSDSFGCKLRLWTVDDDLLLLPVLSVILKNVEILYSGCLYSGIVTLPLSHSHITSL